MKFASLKKNKWVRRGVVALLAWLAFWALLWLAVPPIAKSQIQKIASEKLGREVTIGKIDFKPWTLEVTMNDLRIATSDGSAAQVAVTRIYADAELQSIVRLGPVIDTLTVESPRIQLTRLADGKYDFDDILAKLASAPDAPKEPAGEPPRFAIYNISIAQGSVDFHDKAVEREHELRELTLQVPFLSTLPSQREVQTEPKLAFVLNGSHFDSSALTTPFADNRKSDVTLNFEGLDLQPYLGYIPDGLPVALQSGKLDANLKIDFEQSAKGVLKITGTVGAIEIKMVDARGRDLMQFDSLKVALADVRPLDRFVHLESVALAAPHLIVARDAEGQLNLMAKDAATGAEEKVAAVSPPAAEGAAAKSPEQAVWRVQVDKVGLSDGDVGWRDETTSPAAAIDAKQLHIEATAVTWPMEKATNFSGSTSLGGAAVKFSGEATDKVAKVQTEVEGLPLSIAGPYLAQTLQPSIDGKLSGQIDIAWNQPELKLNARRVIADGLALTQEKTALASVGRFELLDAEVDLGKRTLAIGSFTATNPKIRVERDSEKRWMYERWLKAPASGDQNASADAKVAAPKDAKADAAAKAAGAEPWKLSIAKFALDNGTLSYSDKASATPVAFEITALKIGAQKIAPETDTPSPLQVSGRIGAGRAEAGRFDYKGNVVLKPISTEGEVKVVALPAHAFKAYYADAVNLDIRRAFADYSGKVKFASTPAGMNLKVTGDTAIDNFRANSATLTQSPGASRSNQLLSWKALDLRGLQLDMTPGAPLSVDVRETTLTEFFARVIVQPDGTLNLQELGKKPGEVAASKAAEGEKTTRRSLGGTTTTTTRSQAAEGKGPPVPAEAKAIGEATSPAPASAKAATDGAPGPVINFGPLNLVNGKIDFTDLFIQPNYSADLSELAGKLSSFSTDPKGGKPAMADLELRGKAQQTASLEIKGQINPLAKPLELDIAAKMRDLDLPPLSPYSVRYAGHGIERGKLSMDVSYKIEDGKLTATNKLVLNRLQFGDEVKGAPNSLPVRMAVALLADRDGVIDIDFPVSGSLNDPQFSIGSLIAKAIGNLVLKAVTAPFALLTGGLGAGGGESNAIGFAPGSAELSADAKEALDKLAAALAERPKLEMTISGTASLEEERAAFQRQRLRQMTQTEKRRAAVRGGQAAADVAPVTDAEYPGLLAEVYKRSEIDKPRNAIGFTKDLPTKEMEALLLASIPVDADSMRKLAIDRAAAVRDGLLARKVPAERLFLGALRTSPTDADWKPRVELNLERR